MITYLLTFLLIYFLKNMREPNLTLVFCIVFVVVYFAMDAYYCLLLMLDLVFQHKAEDWLLRTSLK